MEVEREINRQAKMSSSNEAGTRKKDAQPAKTAQRNRRVADVKTKAKNDVVKKKKKQKNAPARAIPPPTWISDMRRPPSATAVTAAITAIFRQL